MSVARASILPSILIIDSDADNREMYCEALSWMGFTVTGARSATEAVNHIVEDRPGVIVMETQLRGMSGYHLLELLRGNDRTRELPVIAVTASVFSHQLMRAVAAGFSQVLPKPCLPETLASTICGLVAPA